MERGMRKLGNMEMRRKDAPAFYCDISNFLNESVKHICRMLWLAVKRNDICILRLSFFSLFFFVKTRKTKRGRR